MEPAEVKPKRSHKKSGEQRGRSPRNWREQHARDVRRCHTKKKPNKTRPNKAKRWRKDLHPNEWKCPCGQWQPNEMPSCDKCGRPRYSVESAPEHPVESPPADDDVTIKYTMRR